MVGSFQTSHWVENHIGDDAFDAIVAAIDGRSEFFSEITLSRSVVPTLSLIECNLSSAKLSAFGALLTENKFPNLCVLDLSCGFCWTRVRRRQLQRRYARWTAGGLVDGKHAEAAEADHQRHVHGGGRLCETERRHSQEGASGTPRAVHCG